MTIEKTPESEWFEQHLKSLKRYEIFAYLKDLFSHVELELVQSESILEIGAGSSLSRNFLKNKEIFRTDILLHNNQIDVAADVYHLPFFNESFDLVFALDVFHHLHKIDKAFVEVHRVLKSGALLLLIEPHISFFSYPVYKIFHHEFTSWRTTPERLASKITSNPLDADNSAISSFLLHKAWSTNRDIVGKAFKLEKIIFRDFISFFATGGLQKNSSLIKGKPYDLFLRLEKKLSQTFLKFFGSRVIVILRKL